MLKLYLRNRLELMLIFLKDIKKLQKMWFCFLSQINYTSLQTFY